MWTLDDVSGAKGGSVDGSGTYDEDAIVPIVAMANEGYRFGEWTGDGIVEPTLPETTIAVLGDSAVTANFIKVWRLSLTASEGARCGHR